MTMFSRIHSSSSSSALSPVTSPRLEHTALTPSALSGVLAELEHHLRFIQQQEVVFQTIQTEYFQAFPKLGFTPSGQDEVSNPIQSALYTALKKRQALLDQTKTVRTSLHTHGLQIKDKRQQIRNVHAEVFNSYMLNQKTIRQEAMKHRRAVAKLRQQQLRQLRDLDRMNPARFQGEHCRAKMLELPELAHAAHCVDLLCPLTSLDPDLINTHKTTSPLLKTLFVLSKAWSAKDRTASSPFIDTLLNPEPRVVTALAEKAELDPIAVKLLMVLMGLNSVMQANVHVFEPAANVQAAIRAVLGRSITSAFVEHQIILGQTLESRFDDLSKSFSELLFPVDGQKKMSFMVSTTSVSGTRQYLKHWMAGLSQLLTQAAKQSMSFQPVIKRFHAALLSSFAEAHTEGFLALVRHVAQLSFPSLPQMKAYSSQSPGYNLLQSNLGQTLVNDLGMDLERFLDGNDVSLIQKETTLLQRFYLDYSPTPEQPYLVPNFQQDFNAKLSLLGNEALSVKQVINPSSVPEDELLTTLMQHNVGALIHQRACIPIANECAASLQTYQELALELNGLECELNDVEREIQHCIDHEQYSKQQKNSNKIKERELFTAMQQAETTLKEIHHQEFALLIDSERSPLLPLFVHRDAFDAFISKHVNISTEQLKQRVVEQAQTASRYNKAEGVLRAILDVYALANLQQYGGPNQQKVVDDEVFHATPVGTSVLMQQNGRLQQAKAGTSVFSLRRESPNQPWRIWHLFPKC